jgi:hypothetical protein
MEYIAFARAEKPFSAYAKRKLMEPAIRVENWNWLVDGH